MYIFVMAFLLYRVETIHVYVENNIIYHGYFMEYWQLYVYLLVNEKLIFYSKYQILRFSVVR